MSKQSRRPPQEEKPARRSWRGQKENGSAAGARAPAAQTGWRRGRAPRNDLARKWMIGVPMIVVVLGLFCTAGYLVIRLPPPTPLVTVYVSDYESPLAPHAFALEDIEQLLHLFRPAGYTGSITVRGDAADREIKAADKDRFLARLKEDLLAQQPIRRWGHNKPQLVYLSAQGVLNEAGEPCLVLAAGDRDGEAAIRTPRQVLAAERLVRVEEVVDLLAEVHPHAHKVLLLDCIRAGRNWRLGIAANGFAARLNSINLNTPSRGKVVILHACSPGEVGLVDLRKGLTLFGEYVGRGLAGEADADRDEAVELRELYAYLQDRLQAAAARRSRTQQPLLHASGENLDFPLATADARATAAAEQQYEQARFQPASSWLADIHAGWAALARRRAQNASPAAESLLLDEAQRQHWQQQMKYCLAGRAYATYQEKLGLNATVATRSLPSVSLPLALGQLALPTDQEQQARTALVPPPADQPPPEQPPPPATAEDYYALAAVVWKDALDGIAADAHASAKLAEARRQSGALAPVELRSLERFHPQNAHLPKTARDATSTLLQFRTCRSEAEQAAFVEGQPRVLRHVQTRLDQADQERREREDALFGGQLEDEGLTALQEKLRAIQKDAAGIAAALALRDRLWADLPYWLEWAVVEGPSEQAQAAALLEGLGALEQALAAPAGQAVDWPQLAGRAEAAERELRRSYTDAWQKNVELTPTEGVLSQVPALERLLAAPVANLELREQLWKKYWGIVAGPTTAERPANYSQEAARVAQQADAAAKLLGQWLAAVPAPSDRDGRLSPEARFLGLMDAAAAAIGQVEAGDLSDEQLRDELARREPLSRAAASWLTLVPTSALARHSIGQRAELAEYDYCLWQARRTLEDFLGNDDRPAADGSSLAQPGTSELPYFAVAAAQLIEHAERLLPKRKATDQVRQLLASRQRDAGLLAAVVLAWPREPLPTGQNSAVVERLPNPLDVQSLPPGRAALRASGEWQQVAMGNGPESLVPLTGGALVGVQASDSGWPARFEFTLDPAQTDQKSAGGDVSYYYRGHAATVRGHLDRLLPLYRVVSQSPGREGKLAVGSPNVRAKVLIMLDCSRSMEALISDRKSRMEAGKDAVHEAITELLALGDERKASDVKVALMLFGHRRHASDPRRPFESWKIPWNEEFGRDTGIPYEKDFEIEWISSGNKQRDRESLNELLAKIQPTGLTPLYAAMESALTSGFKKLRGDGGSPQEEDPLHLLIVSDGDDNIPPVDAAAAGKFVPGWDQNYNSPESRRQRSARIRPALADINLYFFDFARGNELRKVAIDLNLRDDQIVPIKDADLVAPELLRRVGVYRYAVDDRAGLVERQHGSSARREEFVRQAGQHALSFMPDDARPTFVRIGGGEALEVQIPAPPERPEFRFARWPEQLAAGAARGQVTLDAAAVESDFQHTLTAYEVLCRAEREKRGERNDRQCRFDLVLQNKAAGQFTPRPAELWVEIVPLDESDKPLGAFSYCNPFPAKDTAVPVYELTVPKWPAGSRRALVQVWVRMQATTALQAPQVTLQTHAQRKPAKDGLPGVEFKFEASAGEKGASVTITESFAAGAAADQRHFVRLASQRDVARVERTYYDGQVEHEFFLAGRSVDDAQAVVALVVPQERWKKGAAGLDGGTPLEVAIAEE